MKRYQSIIKGIFLMLVFPLLILGFIESDRLISQSKNDLAEGAIKDKLVVASCQFPVTGDVLKNAEWIGNQMRKAKMSGADIVHFPECALSGYGGEDIKEVNEFDWDEIKIQTTNILKLAKKLKLWVILGSSHNLSKGHKPHNSLYVINPEGQITDRYDKRFCTSSDLDYYTPGDHFVVFEVNNIK